MPTRIERIHRRTRLTRLTDVLFMIGSVCFVLGSIHGYTSAVGVAATGATYFVGSIFFTSAGYLQYLLASNPTVDFGWSGSRGVIPRGGARPSSCSAPSASTSARSTR